MMVIVIVVVMVLFWFWLWLCANRQIDVLIVVSTTWQMVVRIMEG